MDKKKVYVTPNFRNMQIIENPFLQKKDNKEIIAKPEDVEKYWDEDNKCYRFGKVLISCALDLSEYLITAESISTTEPLYAKAINCKGQILGTKIIAQEINCDLIFADEVSANKLIYSDFYSINSLSVVTLQKSESNVVEK